MSLAATVAHTTDVPVGVIPHPSAAGSHRGLRASKLRITGEQMHEAARSNSSSTTMSNAAPKRRAKPSVSDDRASSDEGLESKRHKTSAQLTTAGTPKMPCIYNMNSTMSSQAAFHSPNSRAQNIVTGSQAGQRDSLPPLMAPTQQRGGKGNLPPLQPVSGGPAAAADILLKGQQLLASGQVPDHLLDLLRGTIAQIERVGSGGTIAGGLSLAQLSPGFSAIAGARGNVTDGSGELGGHAARGVTTGATEPPPRLVSQATPLGLRLGAASGDIGTSAGPSPPYHGKHAPVNTRDHAVAVPDWDLSGSHGGLANGNAAARPRFPTRASGSPPHWSASGQQSSPPRAHDKSMPAPAPPSAKAADKGGSGNGEGAAGAGPGLTRAQLSARDTVLCLSRLLPIAVQIAVFADGGTVGFWCSHLDDASSVMGAALYRMANRYITAGCQPSHLNRLLELQLRQRGGLGLMALPAFAQVVNHPEPVPRFNSGPPATNAPRPQQRRRSPAQ